MLGKCGNCGPELLRYVLSTFCSVPGISIKLTKVVSFACKSPTLCESRKECTCTYMLSEVMTVTYIVTNMDN